MTKTDDSPRCCKISLSRYAGSNQCANPGKVIRDGKPYCGIHDPEAHKRRHQKVNEQRMAEQIARRTAESAACRGVPTEVLRDGLVAELIEIAKAAGVWRAMGMEVNP